MKKILNILFVSAIALASFSSCQKESELLNNGSKEGKKAIMTVKAGNATTKTAITEVGDHNYTLQWTAGDAIAAYEVSTVTSVPTIQPKVTSTALAAAADNATFTMDFSKNGGESDFSYIFVYPAANYNEVSGDYLATIPASQTFKSATFDPDADLLISKPLAAQATRPTSVSAQFERIGATVVMNIKAPTTTEKIRAIYFSTTEGNIAGSVAVDPLAGTYGHTITANQSKEIELIPESEPTYTGTIPVWFRMAAINLDSNFKVVIDTDAKTYTKTVDLSAAGKIVKFEDGGLTKFNVNMESVSGTVNNASITSTNIGSMTGLTSYGSEKVVTVSGKVWVSTGYKSVSSDKYIQLKKDTKPYLELPVVDGKIRRIVLSVTSAADGATEGNSSYKTDAVLAFCSDIDGVILASGGGEETNSITIDIPSSAYRSGYIIDNSTKSVKIWSATVYYTADAVGVSSLSIVTDPTKLTYTTDDDASDIDFTGGKAIATYADGSTANVSRALTFTCDFSTTGTKTVTASYGGQSDTFTVTVNPSRTLEYTFATAKSTTNTAYATNYDVTISKLNWSVPGNQNFDGFVRIGGAKGTNIERVIYAKSPITNDLDQIVIETAGVSNANLSITDIIVTAHSTAELAASGSDGSKVTFSAADTYFDFNSTSAANFTFDKDGSTSTAGYYYRIVIKYTHSKSSNYGLNLSAIKFYSH